MNMGITPLCEELFCVLGRIIFLSQDLIQLLLNLLQSY